MLKIRCKSEDGRNELMNYGRMKVMDGVVMSDGLMDIRSRAELV